MNDAFRDHIQRRFRIIGSGLHSTGLQLKTVGKLLPKTLKDGQRCLPCDRFTFICVMGSATKCTYAGSENAPVGTAVTKMTSTYTAFLTELRIDDSILL